jgi:fumarate reductase iron-sulfur subunit
MTVNGRPRWTCRTHVKKVVEDGKLVIEPLRNLPRIKDLACDLSEFFDKWSKAGGHFEGTKTRNDAFEKVEPLSPERQAANAGIECINCAVCYSACDVVSWRPEYLGPAALNRAWTLVNDVRHADRDKIMDAVSGEGGCVNCHSHGNCTEYCPVEISPTAAIAGLKKAAFKRFLRGGRS